MKNIYNMRSYFLKSPLFRTVFALCFLVIQMPFSRIYGQSFYGQYYAPVNYGQSNVNTVAPTTASLMKAIDHPVSPYSGTPAINHTLFTLHDGSVEIPIALSYTASGIKVAEEASWVGLGWNMNVGGMLVQNVIGRIDSKDGSCYTKYCGNISMNFSAYNGKPYRSGDKNTNDVFFENASRNEYQPDVFYYSFPGGSGKFYKDFRTDSICFLDEERYLKILPQNKSGNSYFNWNLITSDGTSYSYSLSVMDRNRSVMSVYDEPICCTWPLSSVTLPNGQQIKYHYSSTVHDVGVLEQYFDLLVGKNNISGSLSPSAPINQRQNWYELHEILLDSIVTDNYVVKFKKSGRKDYKKGEKLDEIDVCSRQGKILRRFCFDYRYAESENKDEGWKRLGGVPPNVDHSGADLRLILTSVYESDGKGNRTNALNFDYYSPEQLPMKTSYSLDYWGYYNGIGNSSLIPNIDYLEWGLRRNNRYEYQVPKIADRSCDTVLVKTGMLKSIGYQTGGKTAFDYESNRYYGTIYSRVAGESTATARTVASYYLRDCNNASFKRSQEIVLSPGQKLCVTAKLSRGFKKWSDLLQASYLIKCPGSSYEKFFVTINSSGSGTTFTPSDKEYNVSQYSEFTTPGKYEITLNLPDKFGDQYQSSCDHINMEATINITVNIDLDRTYNYGGGVRVKSVSHYDNSLSQSPSLVENYDYEGGSLTVPISFHNSYSGRYAVAIVRNPLEPGSFDNYEEKTGTYQIMRFSSNNFYSDPYSSSGVDVGYKKCTITRKGVANVRTVYEYANPQCVSAKGIPQVNMESWNRGKMLSQTDYDANNKIVRKVRYSYGIEHRHIGVGVVTVDHFNAFPSIIEKYIGGSCITCSKYTGASLLCYDDFDGRYTTMIYPIISNRSYLKSKEVTTDGVTQSEQYDYGKYWLMTKRKTTRSDGNIHSVTYKYPHDFTGTVATGMISRNMLSQPLEILESVNGHVVDGQYTKYVSSNSRYYPSEVYRLNIPSGGIAEGKATVSSNGTAVSAYYPYADARYSGYDSYGNATEITRDGVTTVYVWGYGGQYPVAEVVGSDLRTVTSVLGRSPSTLSNLTTPDWTILSRLKTLKDAKVTLYEWSPLNGQTRMTAPDGLVTDYSYDGFGRLSGVSANGRKRNSYTYKYSKQYLVNYTFNRLKINELY